MLGQAMATVFFSWLMLGAMFLGLGLGVRGLAGPGRSLSPLGAMGAFWVGWAVAIAFLQVWQLALPVRFALVFLLLAGGAGLVWCGREVGGMAWGALRGDWAALAVVVLCGIWLSNLALGSPLYYDTGLYHFSMTRWLADYRLVPGLGNLHARLAYNNSSLLYAAMIEATLWAGKSQHIANGLLLWMLWAQVLGGMWRVLTQPRRAAAYHVFSALWFGAVLKECANHNTGQFVRITSLTPDVAVTVLAAFIGMYLLRFLLDDSREERWMAWQLFVMVALCALAATVKLSLLVASVVAVCVAGVVWWRRSAWEGARGRKRALGWALGAGVVLMGPWAVRGVILSGYPVYPSTFLGVPVSWRMPADEVRERARGDMAWARKPRAEVDEVLSNWDWFASWLGGVRNRHLWVRAPLTMAVAFLATLCLMFLARWAARSGPPRTPGGLWVFLLVPAASLLFWFFTAPNARFAIPLCWMAGAAGGALVVYELRRMAGGEGDGSALAVVAGGLLIAVYFWPGVLDNAWGFKWNEAGPVGGFHPKPVARMRRVVTNSGLIVNVPLAGDQCWDAPVPCAPEVAPALRLRREGELTSGFVVGGEGSMNE